MFPTKNPPPYSDGKFTKIHIEDTPEDLISKLGKPQIKLENGSTWIYGRTRAALTDGFGSYSHDYEAVLVEFSGGRVLSKDLAHGDFELKEVCWSGRICLQPVWEKRSDARKEPKILSRRYSGVTSSGADDARAKSFVPKNGFCAVYIYSGRNFFRSSVPPVLSIGTLRDEPLPTNGFLHYQSPPGHLQLVAGKNKVNIECDPGSLHFYKLDKYLGTGKDNISVKVASLDAGREAIQKRHLLLTW